MGADNSMYLTEWNIDGLTLSNFEALLKPKVREFVETIVPSFQFSSELLDELRTFSNSSQHRNDYFNTGLLFHDWNTFIETAADSLIAAGKQIEDPSIPSEVQETVRRELIDRITSNCFLKTIVDRYDGGVKLVSEATRFEPFGGVHFSNDC